ncbi:MAG: hypothetical protein JNJ89_08730 [Rubrivivax sp.]|nr:hypothetical protein [Rubrivivax sp.]
MLHDALHADVLAALLVGHVPGLERLEIEARVEGNAAAFAAALRELSRLALPAPVAEHVSRSQALAEGYPGEARQLVQLIATDRKAGLAALPDFENQFKHVVLKVLDEQGGTVGDALKTAQAEAAEQADASRATLL